MDDLICQPNHRRTSGKRREVKMFKVGKPSEELKAPTYFWLETREDGALRLLAQKDGRETAVLIIKRAGIHRLGPCRNLGFDTSDGKIALTDC